MVMVMTVMVSAKGQVSTTIRIQELRNSGKSNKQHLSLQVRSGQSQLMSIGISISISISHEYLEIGDCGVVGRCAVQYSTVHFTAHCSLLIARCSLLIA